MQTVSPAVHSSPAGSESGQWYLRSAPDCWNQRRRNLKLPGCRLPPRCCFITQVIQILQQIQPQHSLQWIGFIAALSFVIARLDQRKPFLPRDDPLDLPRNSFFFVRTCANSSLSADIVICLSMVLLYHFWQYRAYFSVRYCPRNSFFFVRTCANSSLSADIVICLSIFLIYHVWLYHAYFSVRCCLRRAFLEKKCLRLL